jgi:hypothetical protein
MEKKTLLILAIELGHAHYFLAFGLYGKGKW